MIEYVCVDIYVHIYINTLVINTKYETLRKNLLLKMMSPFFSLTFRSSSAFGTFKRPLNLIITIMVTLVILNNTHSFISDDDHYYQKGCILNTNTNTNVNKSINNACKSKIHSGVQIKKTLFLFVYAEQQEQESQGENEDDDEIQIEIESSDMNKEYYSDDTTNHEEEEEEYDKHEGECIFASLTNKIQYNLIQ